MKKALTLLCILLVFTTIGSSQTSKKHIEQGNLLYSQGKYEAAIIKYNAAIWLRPSFATPYYLKGNAHVKLEQYSAALEAYTFALMRDSMCTEALLGRYMVYSTLGMRDMAITDSIKIIEISSMPPIDPALLVQEEIADTIIQQMEFHVMAGNKLIEFKKQYYSGFATVCIGVGIIAIGAATIPLGAPVVVGVVIMGGGGITAIIGGVISLVSVKKVGEAGEYLKLMEIPESE
jgi:tetratricopeptide (TPR) repeat protein